eukprot:COSAG04_NODE_1793_length_5565_cov_52.214782_6_plen_92_part_00
MASTADGASEEFCSEISSDSDSEPPTKSIPWQSLRAVLAAVHSDTRPSESRQQSAQADRLLHSQAQPYRPSSAMIPSANIPPTLAKTKGTT